MFEFVIILLVLSGAALLVLSIIAFQQRSSALVLSFAVTMFCAAIWNFGFAAEVISPSLDQKIFWANVQFIGIVFLSPGWLVMTMFATGQSRRAVKIIPPLVIIPILTILLAWTNPAHHIFRQSPSINSIGVPFPVLVSDYSPYFYAVHAPYGYLLFLISFYLLFRSWKQTPLIYRRQRSILAVSLAIPLLVDVLYVLGISPIPSFNFTSTVFTISGLLLSMNIFKYHFLDILPLAYEAAITEMDVGVIVLDAPGRVSHLNPAAEKITGVAGNQAIGADIAQIFPVLSPVWTSAQAYMEIAVNHGENEYTYQVTKSAILQRKNKLIGQVITLNDITERVKLHQQIEKLSITDPLTDALNRRALVLHGEQEIQRAHRYHRNLTLILLDVDDFKRINDTYGHPSGDYVLKTIVQTIQKLIRANDFIFRYGGDEFIILLVETDVNEAQEPVNRIHQELEHVSVRAGQDIPLQIQVSLGVTGLSANDNLEIMLQRTDQALYQAKAAGKGQTVWV